MVDPGYPYGEFDAKAEGLPEDPTPPVDDEANDAALPEPELPQGDDVKNDGIEEPNES